MDKTIRPLLLVLIAMFAIGCTADGGFNGVTGGGGSGQDPDITADDSDGDGVDNDSDLCPGTQAFAEVDADGCSEFQLDDDGDGVNNAFDLCPGTPDGESVDGNGCAVSQYGESATIPDGFVCTNYASGNATASEPSGNLCVLGAVLDPILGLLGGTNSCSVTDPENAADANRDTFASMNFTAALLDPTAFIGETEPFSGNVAITVDGFGTLNAGTLASFEVEYPAEGVLDLGILDNVFVTTLLDGVAQEEIDAGEAIQLSLLGVGAVGTDTGRLAIGFIASTAFNQLRITTSAGVLEAGLGSLTSEAELFVYDVCRDAQLPPPEAPAS